METLKHCFFAIHYNGNYWHFSLNRYHALSVIEYEILAWVKNSFLAQQIRISAVFTHVR